MKTLGTPNIIGSTALALALSPLAVNAQVDGVTTASDGYTAGYLFDVEINNTSCAVDLSDCGTLMVNDSGGMTQFALILPLSLKDNTYGANADGYNQKFSSLTGSDKLIMDLNGNELAMDFLNGVTDKDDGPVFESGFTGREDSPSPGSEPSWALAAATSMEYNYLASNPDGINAPTHFGGKDSDSPVAGDAAFDFWEFQHIYEWKVDNTIWENGQFSIDQVGITEIHLSPEKDDFTDNPPIIGCTPNDPNDCLPPDPGCDPSTDPNGCQPPPNGVPLPSSVLLMLIGLGLLTGRRAIARRTG